MSSILSLRHLRALAAFVVPLLANGCAASASTSVGQATTTAAAASPAAKDAAEAPKEETKPEAAPEETKPLMADTLPDAPPLADVVADAKGRGAPILLYFSTTWCEPCKVLDEKVFPNAEVAHSLESWRFQKYDAEKGAGVEAAKTFGVRSYPTLVALSPDGREVDRLNAPLSPNAFINRTRPLAEIARKGPISEADAATERDLRRLMAAAHVAERADRISEARAFYQAVIRIDSAGQIGAGPEASVALMRLSARTAVRKDHAARLKKHLVIYRDAPAAGAALEGLAALVPESLPMNKALVHSVGMRVMKARASDAWALDRLAMALDRLDDAEGAAAVRAAAATAPRERLSPDAHIAATMLRDPLEPSPLDQLMSATKPRKR
jgi:thioredoxin-like negative regulator of GroEL